LSRNGKRKGKEESGEVVERSCTQGIVAMDNIYVLYCPKKKQIEMKKF
jgi:hypothetical protein